MQQNLVQSKLFRCGFGNDPQLVLGHGFESFIIDPVDLATVFQTANDSQKIDHRSGGKIDIFSRHFQARFGQQNLRNGVCHAFESPITM